jgi:hypothetical protein
MICYISLRSLSRVSTGILIILCYCLISNFAHLQYATHTHIGDKTDSPRCTTPYYLHTHLVCPVNRQLSSLNSCMMLQRTVSFQYTYNILVAVSIRRSCRPIVLFVSNKQKDGSSGGASKQARNSWSSLVLDSVCPVLGAVV